MLSEVCLHRKIGTTNRLIAKVTLCVKSLVYNRYSLQCHKFFQQKSLFCDQFMSYFSKIMPCGLIHCRVKSHNLTFFPHSTVGVIILSTDKIKAVFFISNNIEKKSSCKLTLSATYKGILLNRCFI